MNVNKGGKGAPNSGGHKVNGAKTELGPLGRIQAATVHVHIGIVKLGNRVLHAAEIADKVSASIRKGHERVDVGLAPLAPHDIVWSKINHWDVRLAGRERGREMSDDKRGIKEGTQKNRRHPWVQQAAGRTSPAELTTFSGDRS